MGQSGQPRRILVVIDPASTEQPALDKAARIAMRGGATLELHVCDVDEGIPESWTGSGHVKEYRALREQRQLQELERLAAPLRARGLHAECTWQWHAPLELGIGHHVIRTRPDLVVKGTHRHVPLPRGSVTHTDWNLIRQLPAPLLLVHARAWPAAPRVAAAVDPCHPADRPASLDTAVLDQARALAKAPDGTVEVLHVLQMPPHLPGEEVAEEVRTEAYARAREAVGKLAHGGGVEPHFTTGRVVEGLLRLVGEHRPDVLVVGTTARPRSIHAAAGGTVARILEAVDCDLLVVKPPGFVSPLLVTD